MIKLEEKNIDWFVVNCLLSFWFFFSTGMKMAVDLTPAKIAHTFNIFYKLRQFLSIDKLLYKRNGKGDTNPTENSGTRVQASIGPYQ